MPKKQEISESESSEESEKSESETSVEESESDDDLTKKMKSVKVSSKKAEVPSSSKKSASKKPVEHITEIVKHPPKRALTTYNHYVSAKLKEFRLKYPGRESTKYMKMAAASWSKMSTTQKEAFAKKIEGTAA